MKPTITMTPTISKELGEALRRATKADAHEAFLAHADKANEYVELSAALHGRQSPEEDARYWMLHAIFETLASIAVLLQGECDI